MYLYILRFFCFFVSVFSAISKVVIQSSVVLILANLT